MLVVNSVKDCGKVEYRKPGWQCDCGKVREGLWESRPGRAGRDVSRGLFGKGLVGRLPRKQAVRHGLAARKRTGAVKKTGRVAPKKTAGRFEFLLLD